MDGQDAWGSGVLFNALREVVRNLKAVRWNRGRAKLPGGRTWCQGPVQMAATT